MGAYNRSVVFSAISLLACGQSFGPPAGSDAMVVRTDGASIADGSSQSCAAQSARAGNASPMRQAQLIRYRWTGLSCRFTQYRTERDNVGRPIEPPSSCEGADCAAIFSDEADCIARYAHCGAVLEHPQRGMIFDGIPAPGVACGSSQCAPGEECAWEITSNCRPPNANLTRRLRCDDPSDCDGANRCCVSEDGPYLVSTCRTSCDATSSSAICTSAQDCAAGERCCVALPRYFVSSANIGVCTSRACETE